MGKKYQIRADDERGARWEAAAAEAGLSFSEWARGSLDAVCQPQVRPVAVMPSRSQFEKAGVQIGPVSCKPGSRLKGVLRPAITEEK